MGEAIALPAVRSIGNEVTEASVMFDTIPVIEQAEAQIPIADGNFIEQLNGRGAFVAASPSMREVRRQVEQVADTGAVVLLQGESGTGKDVVARLIHKLSSRASHTFLRVNCAALPADLLESELFGYEAGAFTGARQQKAGKFQSCHNGTIFLDEIAEMPTSLQAKLLHVLQDGEFSRLGSTSTVRVDVRVLAATNVNVRQAVQTGTFRNDLYYRLNVFRIYLPPLRERKEDLPYLLNYMMTTWAASYGRPCLPITKRILEACAKYSWPGNVRELESFIKRYLVLGDESQALSQLDGEQEISRAPAFAEVSTQIETPGIAKRGNLKSLVRRLKSETECAAILQALEKTHGCKQETAKLLGISLRALHYKIRRYGIQRYSCADQPSWTAMMAPNTDAAAPESRC